MGAVLNCKVFDGKLTEDQVRKQYLSVRHDMMYEHGTDPYNGTWSTLDEHVVIHKDVLDSHSAADAFIDLRAEKRGAAHAVQFKDLREEATLEPTFMGSKKSACFPAYPHCEGDIDYSTRAVVRVPAAHSQVKDTWAAAEQLKPAEQAKLVEAVTDWHAKFKEHVKAKNDLAVVLDRIKNPSIEVVTADFAAVKKLRKQLEKIWAATSKAALKLYTLDKKYAARLYKIGTVDHGLFWLVGGLCAE